METLIAATMVQSANDAAEAIAVDYEALPAVADPRDALLSATGASLQRLRQGAAVTVRTNSGASAGTGGEGSRVAVTRSGSSTR